MKKIFVMAFLAAGLVLTGCSKGPEARCREYVDRVIEATERGDLDELRKISDEVEAYEKTLSPEDKQIFEETQAKLQIEYKDKIEAAGKKAAEVLGDKLDELNDVVEDAAEEVEEAVDEAVEEAEAEE